MGTIYLDTLGGLANRMRLIASGLWLQKIDKSSIVCFWEENHALNCPFHLLYESIDGVEIAEKGARFRHVHANNQSTFIKRQAAFFLNKLAGVDYCIEENDFSELIWKGKLDIASVKKNNKRVYFKTYEEFGENKMEFQKFKPVAFLQDKINDVKNRFAGNTIGVHIRRTDHATSIECSPTELFIAKMQEEIEKDNSVKFFLCTDDAGVETEMRNFFNERIITFDKEMSRETQKGVQDALVDLYCLSFTQKIYGSHMSSFSEISARLNGAELICLKR